MVSWRDFVPPVAATLYRHLRRRNGVGEPTLYPSFDAAARTCEGFGYEESTLLRSLRLKAESHREACRYRPPVLTPGETLLLAAIGLAKKPEVKVLDYGGGPGRHYFSLRATLPASIALRWNVVETPGMAREAASLRTGEMAVFGSLSEASDALGTPDVVFTSGALQCIPAPERVLRDLCGLGANCMVFARTATASGQEPIVIVQESRISWNGGFGLPPGIEDRAVKYPLMFMTKTTFDTVLSERYRVTTIVGDDTGVEGSVSDRVTGCSLLARLGPTGT
jgi:putative methyltransferase (TIGR04325 family)